MKLALKNKGSDNIALIKDSMREAGTSDNKSILGSRKKGQEVLVEDGVAKMPDKQSFAGSIATADRLVRNMYQMGGATVEEAVTVSYTHLAGGPDFMDCTVEDCLTIAKTHMKHGTTLLLSLIHIYFKISML